MTIKTNINTNTNKYTHTSSYFTKFVHFENSDEKNCNQNANYFILIDPQYFPFYIKREKNTKSSLLL
jgi:hypothetical protein